jgi:tetratricopeptide (TPR) repeat protein
MSRVIGAVCLFILSLSMVGVAQPVSSDSASASAVAADTKEADEAFHSGKFSDAAAKYQAVLQKDSSSIPAQAGLVRSMLRAVELQQALELGQKFETASPNAALLHTVMGEVRFRRAEMPEAEKEFQRAIALDANQAHAYLGLGKLYDALGLHRKAYDLVQRAHSLAPDDPVVQRRWLNLLPRKERIAALEKYLAAPHAEDPEDLHRMQQYLGYLKALGDATSHPCKLANPVESTETELVRLMSDANHLRAWGLKVRLNDQTGKFLLDTGASGFLVSGKQARKAGVVRIASYDVGGIGDKGANAGYVGYVNVLQVGALEFHDCTVRVVENQSVADEDGLIGANVFQAYLVSLNFREGKVKLDPLPKRPDETAPAVKSLDTEGGDDSKDRKEADQTFAAASSTQAQHLPHDRYIAPEMKSWTSVYRFGHYLLVPTGVNDLPTRSLFLLDTGAYRTSFSKSFAEQLGKLDSSYMRVRGLSGSVKDVYSAKEATLQFGGLRQKNVGTITFDMTKLSQGAGTEISGILGFTMLSMLDLQIDYRDNLVNFNYDPTKLGLPDWNKNGKK